VSQQYSHLTAPQTDPLPVSQHTSSPQELPPSLSAFEDPQEVAAIAARYSPVALLTPQAPEEEPTPEGIIGHPASPEDLDSAHFADQHHQSYSNHHQFHTTLFSHHPTQSADVLQSAADAAAALIHNPAHHGNNGFPLLSGDEVPPGSSLGIADL
jgi:hypothetical protein